MAAALAALRSRPDVNIGEQQGWTIISDEPNKTLWSFTPSNHPAHPAAVKREILQKDGAFYISMSALCQAKKSACDQLIAEFQALNDRMKESIQRSAR